MLLAGLIAAGTLLAAFSARAAMSPAGTERGVIGFTLERARVSPKQPYFAGPRRPKLRFRFSARRRIDLRIAVIELRTGKTVAAWPQRRAVPGSRYQRRWNGVKRRGGAARDGRYEFRVGAKGRPLRYAGRFRLRGHAFPVDAPHRSRGAVGEFGSPRNGGRTHEGYDILADCGTPLVTARGGKVRKVGYDSRLYGHFLLINGRKSDESYFYSHLISAPGVREGERVRTGQRVGKVGQTGNASSTPCHLHFELRREGRPIDPWPELRRWDRWS
jgi:murein DD-endopeptidase MepM/ murein hydrolase activator NlpD